MTWHFIAILFGIWYACEIIITRPSRKGHTSKDRGSAGVMIFAQIASICLGIQAALSLHHCLFPAVQAIRICGLCIYVLGFFLRFYSIFYLGRFFTTWVTIATDHHIVDSGPYRLIRHPSYTGILMLYLGIGLCTGNWATTLIFVVPIFCGLLVRMNVEERALREALGEPYANYMKKTKRLIPLVY